MQVEKAHRPRKAVSQRRRKATPEQYFATEVRSVRKHEYIDGEIRLIAYTSENHGLIVANLIIALGTVLKGSPCRVYPSDRMLSVGAVHDQRPHAVVTCMT